MALRNRTIEPVSGGAMADIAFLLLIFFFIATTIMEDKGILVTLPHIDAPKSPPSKNVFQIHVNANDELMAQSELIDVEQMVESMQEFVLNPRKKPDLPSKPTKAVISLHCDRGTSYQQYIAVYDGIKRAYSQMWNVVATGRYGREYAALSVAQQRAIRKDIPYIVSEADVTDLARSY